MSRLQSSITSSPIYDYPDSFLLILYSYTSLSSHKCSHSLLIFSLFRSYLHPVCITLIGILISVSSPSHRSLTRNWAQPSSEDTLEELLRQYPSFQHEMLVCYVVERTNLLQSSSLDHTSLVFIHILHLHGILLISKHSQGKKTQQNTTTTTH